MFFELPVSYFFEEIDAFPFSQLLSDGISLSEYFSAKNVLLSNLQTEMRIETPKNVVIEGNVFIDSGTVIECFARICGPVYIGKNVLIRSHALIRPGTMIGDDVVIGHASEVKNAHIAADAKIASLTFVGDSILGRGARVGSGTITGNRRFDQQEIVLNKDGKNISTGQDKFGCILGDYVRLGSNVSMAPGTVIGKNTWVYSNASMSGFVPGNSIAKLRQDIDIVPKRGDSKLIRLDRDGNL